MTRIKKGDCVRIPDGRIGRVREIVGGKYRVRVRRQTSKTHQFLMLSRRETERTSCPKDWMSPAGYERYLNATLSKMKERLKQDKRNK